MNSEYRPYTPPETIKPIEAINLETLDSLLPQYNDKEMQLLADMLSVREK